MPNNTSPHILSTSSNLLGFCLIVITSLHISEKSQHSLIDEVASVVAMILAVSCLCSFASIRSENTKMEKTMEDIADFLFFMALAGILMMVFYLTIKLWGE